MLIKQSSKRIAEHVCPESEEKDQQKSRDWFQADEIRKEDQLKMYKEWSSSTLQIEEEVSASRSSVKKKKKFTMKIEAIKVDSPSESGSSN